MKSKIGKIIKVKYPTHLKDLKVGDVVITAELHEIIEIGLPNSSVPKSQYIKCVELDGWHPYIKHIGNGQQGIWKVVGGVRKFRKKR
jgi:hypothetical protein